MIRYDLCHFAPGICPRSFASWTRIKHLLMMNEQITNFYFWLLFNVCVSFTIPLSLSHHLCLGKEPRTIPSVCVTLWPVFLQALSSALPLPLLQSGAQSPSAAEPPVPDSPVSTGPEITHTKKLFTMHTYTKWSYELLCTNSSDVPHAYSLLLKYVFRRTPDAFDIKRIISFYTYWFLTRT